MISSTENYNIDKIKQSQMHLHNYYNDFHLKKGYIRSTELMTSHCPMLTSLQLSIVYISHLPHLPSEYPTFYNGVKEEHNNRQRPSGRLSTTSGFDHSTRQSHTADTTTRATMSPASSIDSGMHDCVMPQHDPLTDI